MATSRAPLRFAEAVSVTVSAAGKSGFFFDFDGTLAPLARDPGAVVPVAGAVERLAALSKLVGRVAVVSARPAAFLRERFAHLTGVRLYGLDGLQTVYGGEIRTDRDAEPWAPVMRRLAEDAARDLPGEVLVEDRGLMVALHYRSAPAARCAVERWASARAAELGLTERLGRMVVELRPPLRRDQGTVIAEEAAALTTAWYFGDDVSDARAFEALREKEQRDPAFVGVRVAVANIEAGDELERQADLTLGSSAEIPMLLDEVITAFAGPR